MSASPIDEESTHWTVVATVPEVAKTGLCDVLIGRRSVLLVYRNQQILAFQGICPHQSARLADGLIIDDSIQCPHHLARFRLDNGQCSSGWQLSPLKRYAVKTDGDDILLPDPLLELD